MDRIKAPIAYVTRSVPEYRRPILEYLNDRLDGRLIVFAGSFPESSFDGISSKASANYEYHSLSQHWIGHKGALFQNYSRVFSSNPVVILAEESPRTISLPWLLANAKRKNIGTLLWGHFSSNNRRFSPRHPFDLYRMALAKWVDACVCYTDDVADLLRPYVPDESCFVARNTLDTHTLFRLYESLTSEGKETIRSQLGIPIDSKTLIYIGRLIPDKRPKVLLDLHKSLSEETNSTLIIIGDGPERENINAAIKNESINNVFLLGAISDLEDSAAWMYASDIMVCPGYVGLNVNHALCMGLPVITYDSPDPKIRYHSPEIAFLINGVNGMIVDHNKFEALVSATHTVLGNLQKFSSSAYNYAQTHLTSDIMTDGLEAAINYCESVVLARKS